jgi:hypothetical protein
MEPAELRGRFVQMLFDRISESRYPSPKMLDRTESAIQDLDMAESYIELLINLTDQDQYPSPQMLDRITGLLNQLDAAAAATA